MRFIELYIAWRYLLSKRKIRFINIIAIISITGITIGVVALLIALSVYNGFTSVVTDILVSFDPHIRIEKRGEMNEDDLKEITKILNEIPNINGMSPFIYGKGMLMTKAFNRVVVLRGIDEKEINKVSGLMEKIVFGDPLFDSFDDINNIIIGLALADKLGIIVGDEVAVISPNLLMSGIGIYGGIPSAVKFRITGIYESNNRDYDANYAYIPLNSAQVLFNMPNKYHGVDVRLTNYRKADEVKEMLSKKFDGDFIVSTWFDLHRSLYSIMNLERLGAYILLSLIILVATFNMLGSLNIGVVEKKRDIGVLKALGATSDSIVRIFMLEGLFIGVIGTILGIMIGLAILYLQINFHLFPLDTTVFIIPAIPVKIQWGDFIAVSFASFSLSFLASYYPARRAAKLLIADSLRWE